MAICGAVVAIIHTLTDYCKWADDLSRVTKNKKHFVRQLAKRPLSLRYLTAYQLWQAMRLGLYRTVTCHQPIIKTPKSKVVYMIAKLKRRLLDDKAAKAVIVSILTNNRYAKWHKEFVKEVFYLYPQVFVAIFEQGDWLTDGYYQGLYLSYWGRHCHNNANNQLARHLIAQLMPSDINRYCLVNNIALDDKDKLRALNQMLSSYGLSPLAVKGSKFCVVNLTAAPHKTDGSNVDDLNCQANHQAPVVSVLVTAYNAAKTLAVCLESLLNQSYQALQIIVIDDASDDKTGQIMQQFAKQDKRIMAISLPNNVGTFVAKSIGASYATGLFLTCQDSDDFAHPQKIARQVAPLLKDKTLIASTSYWLKIDDDGQYYVRQYYPFFRQNPASLLFYRQQVMDKIGLWHLAFAGADSEFYHRLLLFYGDGRICSLKQPLTFGAHRTNSLMNSPDFGAYQAQSALHRLDYWEAWKLWHIECLASGRPLVMPTLTQQLVDEVFDVDDSLWVNRTHIGDNLDNLQIHTQQDLTQTQHVTQA